MSLSNPANTVKAITSQLPLAHRLLAGVLGINEGHHGLAHTKFAQDVAMVWAPKALISRSDAERTEVTMLEFVENFLVYYVIAGSARYAFFPLASKISGVPKALLTQPLNTALHTPLLNKTIATKAAVVLASLGTAAFAGEYVLNFAKNLMTEKVFKMSRFSDVASLSSNKAKAQEKKPLSPTGQKAMARIGQSLVITAGLLGAAFSLARFGGGNTPITRMLGKILPKVDFGFSGGVPGLSKPLLLGYMGIAFVSYLDACRDNLERVEVATRLGIVLSFLFGGQELIQKAAVRIFGKMVPDVLRPDRSIKPLTEIASLAIQRGGGSMAQTTKAFLPMLLAKEALFFIPMAICVVLPGIILGRLNQFWTAKRFDANKHAQPEQAALGYRVPTSALPRQASIPSQLHQPLYGTTYRSYGSMPTLKI